MGSMGTKSVDPIDRMFRSLILFKGNEEEEDR